MSNRSRSCRTATVAGAAAVFIATAGATASRAQSAPTTRATEQPPSVQVYSVGRQPGLPPGLILKLKMAIARAHSLGRQEKVSFLGVSAVAVDGALRDQLRLPQGVGLVVTAVETGSPAEAAGVRVHDVVAKVDDQWAVNAAQFGVVVRLHKAGEEVTLSVVRQGQPQSVKAKLVEREVFVSDVDDAGDAALAVGGMAGAVPDGGWSQLLRVPASALTAASLKGLLAHADADVVISENGRTVTVKSANGSRHLVVVGADGNVSFDGPIDTPDQRKAVPHDVSAVLEAYKDQIDAVDANGTGVRWQVRIIRADR